MSYDSDVESPNHRRLRYFLFAMLVLGLLGTGTELLFLGHDESATQLVPLVVIGVALVVTAWYAASGSAFSVLAMRLTMTACVLAGGLGVALHYRGSSEFQKEVNPSLQGYELFMKIMQAKAPPALAPGMMAHLGLLGLVCAHPLIQRPQPSR